MSDLGEKEAPAELVGHVHSVETAGTLDGPGIRFVVFLTGCPMRCVYCHNPDTWQVGTGRKRSVDHVMAEIDRYADFLIKSGGVTFSGGEPLVQSEFLGALLHRCKKRGLHTAVDTAGILGDRMSEQMLADTDLVLLDLKAFDPALHRKVTGSEVAPVLEFARRLAAAGKPVWIRFVLVPGLTDDLEDVGRLADLVADLDNVERVEVLPFHKMGEYKWQALGLDYTLGETEPPSEGLTERVRGQFRERGLVTY